MSVRTLWERQWIRRALVVVIVLALVAPAFAWAAGQVGYTEPLELAAEETGATDDADPVTSGPLPDYSVPGLPTPVGTLLSALLGSGVVLLIGLGIGRLLADGTARQ